MIPPKLVFPLKLACPKCRYVFNFSEKAKPILVDGLAICPKDRVPLLSLDAARAQIVADHHKKN